MIIDDFYVTDLAVVPSKADAVPTVDADRVLTPAISAESLQAIPRRNGQRLKRRCIIDNGELPTCEVMNIWWARPSRSFRGAAEVNIFRALVRESNDHRTRLP